jgi:hypothetical protein
VLALLAYLCVLDVFAILFLVPNARALELL